MVLRRCPTLINIFHNIFYVSRNVLVFINKCMVVAGGINVYRLGFFMNVTKTHMQSASSDTFVQNFVRDWKVFLWTFPGTINFKYFSFYNNCFKRILFVQEGFNRHTHTHTHGKTIYDIFYTETKQFKLCQRHKNKRDTHKMHPN